MDQDDFACQKVIEVFHGFKESDDAKRAYMWSLTSQQRLAILQYLREQQWGDLGRAKIQKVFESTRALSRADRLESDLENLPKA